jgi:hypothetical protein
LKLTGDLRIARFARFYVLARSLTEALGRIHGIVDEQNLTAVCWPLGKCRFRRPVYGRPTGTVRTTLTIDGNVGDR